MLEALHEHHPRYGSGQQGQPEKKPVESPAGSGDFALRKRERGSQTVARQARNHDNLRYCRDCSSLPGLKRTALPGGIATSAPVRGLRPMPVFRGRTLKMPNPRSSIRSPCASARFMLSKTVSTAISAFVFVIPVLLTTSLMISSLITASPLRYVWHGLKTDSPPGATARLEEGANPMIGLGLIACQAGPAVCHRNHIHAESRVERRQPLYWQHRAGAG